MGQYMCGDSLTEKQLDFPLKIGGAIPTSPLQMIIREIQYANALNFYKQHHYLGNTKFLSTINYGSYFDNILRGVISFGCPNAKAMKGLYDKHTQKGWFEIKRLAMDNVAPFNSESRFIAISIKILLKTYTVKGIITMADIGANHSGIIYKASGFQYIGLTAKKSDFVCDSKIIQRGKVADKNGVWKPRSQKHLFVKIFKI